MNKLSFIVPVYKIKEEYLRFCIESLINQTNCEYEIILVNDGSPDNCGIICDEYGNKFPNIKVIHQENQGVSVARNTGINVATGEYIAFVDADDWIAPDFCEKTYEFAKNKNVDILLFGHTEKSNNHQEEHLFGEDYILQKNDIEELQICILNSNNRFASMCPASPWGKLFRTEFLKLEKLEYIPGLKRMQDNVFCINSYSHTNAVAYLNYNGYFWRKNIYSVCLRYNPEIIESSEKVLKELDKYVKTRHLNNSNFTEAYWCKINYILIGEYMRSYFMHPDTDLSKRQRNVEFKNLIQSAQYKDAINSVDSTVLLKKYKILTSMLKYRMYNLFWFTLDLENFLKTKLKKTQKSYE